MFYTWTMMSQCQGGKHQPRLIRRCGGRTITKQKVT